MNEELDFSNHKSFFSNIKKWIINFFRILVLLGKSVFLFIEKRRLFEKLGKEVFNKYENGSFKDERFEISLSKIENINKEIEEHDCLIREIRFGKSSSSEANNETV